MHDSGDDSSATLSDDGGVAARATATARDQLRVDVRNSLAKVGEGCRLEADACPSSETKCSTTPKILDISRNSEMFPLTVADEASERQLELLLKRQAGALPSAKRELRRYGRKTGHWAWWAFPTEKPGSAEPHPRTKVTVHTAPHLLSRAPPEWREVLELIADLVEEAGDISSVIPSIDHGRIIYFIKFWRSLEETPVWLLCVCQRLDEQLACPL